MWVGHVVGEESKLEERVFNDLQISFSGSCVVLDGVRYLFVLVELCKVLTR